MDLLKTMLENRKAQGLTSKAIPNIHGLPSPGNDSKADIIENKPKKKVVMEHFKSLIERYCNE